MLAANIIYFSRTLARDYRWIYSDSGLQPTDLENIILDYAKFELDPYSYNQSHLIVRFTTNGLALYVFEVTDREDAFSRKVLAIKGLSLTNFDANVANKMLEYIVAYLLFVLIPNKAFDVNIDDILTNAKMPIRISVDECINYCRSNECVLAFVQNLHQFLTLNPGTTAFKVNELGMCELVNCARYNAVQKGTEENESLKNTWGSADQNAYEPVQQVCHDNREKSQSGESLLARIKNRLMKT